jgi:hypothetical protein
MKHSLLLVPALLFSSLVCMAQQNDKFDSTRVKALEIYGFVMTDAGYNFDQINPNWFDALRITKLPSYKDQFAPDGKVFFGIRQSRFGVKGYTTTPIGELKTVFEFDLFGTGADEGQTTMRLRHIYAELGRFAIGQTNSPFMDGDVWPNTVEYWGPSGMVFYRNIQIRYAIMQGTNQIYVALERPGASADQGTFDTRNELDSVRGHLILPDLSAHYKRSGDWGHVQIAGMLRDLRWKDVHTTGGYNVSDNILGWGLHFSTVLNLGSNDVFRGSFVYGHGIENYMQDAPIDVGVKEQPGNTAEPFTGKALPVTGIHAYLDHNWTSKLSTSIGYSTVHIENTDAALPSAYRMGQYASVNLVSTPFSNALAAIEFQWGRRSNFTDNFHSDIFKIQLAFKYNFSEIFYKNKD